jgi:hypothetical protein
MAVTEGLLLLGTALTIFWQPLTGRIPLKASDLLFGLAVCAWIGWLFSKRREPRTLVAPPRVVLPPMGLLASLIVATLFGYWRYGLTVDRGGIILLGRLAVCIALFVATYHLCRTDRSFGSRISFALLSPVVLVPAMMIPAWSARMWVQGRFQGLTVNPNTADLGICITLALAFTLGLHDLRTGRRTRAVCLALVAAAMVTLIILTQSRAYLAGAFASVVVGALLTPPSPAVPRTTTAALAAAVFLIIVFANLLIVPQRLMSSYVARISWGMLAPASSDTQAGPLAPVAPQPAGRQALAWSNWILRGGRPTFVHNQVGALDDLERVRNAGLRRFLENPHVQAAILYAELLPSNPLGLGVNYVEKFFVYFPWINGQHHGTNSILDIPIYGGIGAVLSAGCLMLLVARKSRDRSHQDIDDALPYANGTAAAFLGLWVAAILLGSPIFDYQFWIVTAIALA